MTQSTILQGKVAVVTGGSRGLGLAIAEAYAAAGARVVVASRSPASVEQAVEKIQSSGGQVSGLAVDVADLSQVQALAAHALQAFGRLDTWVNNAGIAGPYGPTLDVEPQAFYQLMQTNMSGVYNGSRTALRHFLAQGSGKLINLLGHGYQGPVPFQNAYSASKAWVRSFTLALAAETRGSGVGVFAFNPGMVLTELLTSVDVIEGHEYRLKVFPTVVRILAKPADVAARKALWLASPATDGKTGLLVSSLGLAGILSNALRVLLRRPAPALDIQIHSVAKSEE